MGGDPGGWRIYPHQFLTWGMLYNHPPYFSAHNKIKMNKIKFIHTYDVSEIEIGHGHMRKYRLQTR